MGPSKEDLVLARQIADQGKEHFAFVSEMDKKEYDLKFAANPNDPEDIRRKEDDALNQAMLDDLREHKLHCDGCSSKVVKKLRKMVDKAQKSVDKMKQPVADDPRPST